MIPTEKVNYYSLFSFYLYIQFFRFLEKWRYSKFYGLERKHMPKNCNTRKHSQNSKGWHKNEK